MKKMKKMKDFPIKLIKFFIAIFGVFYENPRYIIWLVLAIIAYNCL